MNPPVEACEPWMYARRWRAVRESPWATRSAGVQKTSGDVVTTGTGNIALSRGLRSPMSKREP
jgi:hypothetical protein